MNVVGLEANGWFLQQDYLTFLAVLGWLTAGLLAWGDSSTDSNSRILPLKWFAFFCFFTSLDATLDLAKMIAPQVWPREFAAILRLASYGYLMEFARRAANGIHRWHLPPWLPLAIAGGAQAVLFLAPNAAPVPELVVAVVAGLGASTVILTAAERRTRPMLAVAAVLPFLGPGELLRGGSTETANNGLFGLLVTGEGVAAALSAAVLAWVAAAGLWLHGIMLRRSGLFAGRREAFSPLVSIVLPLVLAGTLVAGHFLVNWSAERSRETIDHQYMDLVRTAALSVEPGMVARSQKLGESDASMSAYQRVRRQVRAIESVNPDILRAYLWYMQDGRLMLPKGWLASETGDLGNAAIVRVGTQYLLPSGQAHLLGPITAGDEPLMIANAPVVDNSTRAHLAWLSIDLSATEWLFAQAVARLQVIALVGLFASLLVFFLAHVMLREQEAELLVGKERAEAADRAKDEFLAVMSHEIRTPMHSVLGYSDLLARTPLTGAQASYLDTIRSQGRTLLRIVQDILDFSSLRKSSYTLKAETVGLQRIVETAFDSIRPLAQRKHLRFELQLADSVPEVVRGDGVRIEQVLLNLLNNSVKFTDSGRVRLDVTLERTEPDHHGGERHWVLFTITDTGIGIRPEDAKKLFQPFTRVAADDRGEREGTGLGLAIVKRLCELMGGSIELQSQPGLGSRFFVRIPFVSADADDAIERTTGGSIPSAPVLTHVVNLGAVLPLKILVADDNQYVRRLLIEYLQTIGYQPDATVSGAQAVARWREFDLLILDLRMPEMDGITAAEKIRAASGSETQPWIIGVSATLAEGEVERAMKAGMNDFLGKPFFVQSLIEAIKASPLFERRSADPNAPGDADGNEEIAPPDDAAAGMMSWMPDLTANGNDEVVQQALAEIPEVLAAIEQALGRNDLEAVGERTHYLKNTVFALRIEPMVEPCRAVLERAHARDRAGASQSFTALQHSFQQWKESRKASPTPPQA